MSPGWLICIIFSLQSFLLNFYVKIFKLLRKVNSTVNTHTLFTLIYQLTFATFDLSLFTYIHIYMQRIIYTYVYYFSSQHFPEKQSQQDISRSVSLYRYIILFVSFLIYLSIYLSIYKEIGFKKLETSLVVQWLRICLPVRWTQVRSWVQEDSTCCGAAKLLHHNHWSPRSRACACNREVTTVSNPCNTTRVAPACCN